MATVLFVLTAAHRLTLADGSAHSTGYCAQEFIAPYRAFTAAGHRVVIATPGAVVPTVDPRSLTPEANGGPAAAEEVAAVLATVAELRRPVDLAGVEPGDAVFYPGGHGVLADLAASADSARVLRAALAAGRPIGASCHGVAALLAGEDFPFAGYRLTGFTSAEERWTGLLDRLPWLLQDRLTEAGAEFVAGPAWEPHVVVDRNVHTGQNLASISGLAQRFTAALAG